jgi:hypothetical protein
MDECRPLLGGGAVLDAWGPIAHQVAFGDHGARLTNGFIGVRLHEDPGGSGGLRVEGQLSGVLAGGARAGVAGGATFLQAGGSLRTDTRPTLYLLLLLCGARVRNFVHPAGKISGHVRSRFDCLFSMNDPHARWASAWRTAAARMKTTTTGPSGPSP